MDVHEVGGDSDGLNVINIFSVTFVSSDLIIIMNYSRDCHMILTTNQYRLEPLQGKERGSKRRKKYNR